jgi:hypothetical protein
MRYTVAAVVACGALLCASTVSAQYPNVGIYSTQTGTMESGRASEAWCGLDGTPGPGEPGDTENAQSWDGTSLGAEWRLWGMEIGAAGATAIDQSMDGGGNGWITYSTPYDGGLFWLSKDGAWGDGTVDFTGYLTHYDVITTVTYVGGNPIGATSNISAAGYFDTAPQWVVEFVIANALMAWSPAWGTPMPTGYPPFLCDAPTGELFDVCCITMSFQPPVGTEQYSWGAIKSLYR